MAFVWLLVLCTSFTKSQPSSTEQRALMLRAAAANLGQAEEEDTEKLVLPLLQKIKPCKSADAKTIKSLLCGLVYDHLRELSRDQRRAVGASDSAFESLAPANVAHEDGFSNLFIEICRRSDNEFTTLWECVDICLQYCLSSHRCRSFGVFHATEQFVCAYYPTPIAGNWTDQETRVDSFNLVLEEPCEESLLLENDTNFVLSGEYNNILTLNSPNSRNVDRAFGTNVYSSGVILWSVSILDYEEIPKKLLLQDDAIIDEGSFLIGVSNYTSGEDGDIDYGVELTTGRVEPEPASEGLSFLPSIRVGDTIHIRLDLINYELSYYVSNTESELDDFIGVATNIDSDEEYRLLIQVTNAWNITFEVQTTICPECRTNDDCDSESVCLGSEDDAKCTPCAGCVAEDPTGCDNSLVRDCVCDIDPFCCSVRWDRACSTLARTNLVCKYRCAEVPPNPSPSAAPSPAPSQLPSAAPTSSPSAVVVIESPERNNLEVVLPGWVLPLLIVLLFLTCFVGWNQLFHRRRIENERNLENTKQGDATPLKVSGHHRRDRSEDSVVELGS